MDNLWNSVDKFLFKIEQKDKEGFETYLSPYFVPKAYRIASNDKATVIIEFKYVDVSENKKDVMNDNEKNGQISFQIGEKTKRIYKIYFKMLLSSNPNNLESCSGVVDKAFGRLFKVNNIAEDRYLAALALTKDYLSKKIIKTT